jgi:lipoyl(octanoyl) transferase
MGDRALEVHYLGRLPYREAWALQRSLVERRKADQIADTLLLLEHDPVVTLGRDGRRDHLKQDTAFLSAQGVELVESDRGGDVTFHGPGQVVGYPIIDLRPDCKDVRRYVRRLEQTMIDTVAEYGLLAERIASAPGVWLGSPDRKIGAIGARISRWVTHHGFALNVNTDLDYFDLIVPCGISDKSVTSMSKEVGHRLSMIEVMERLAHHLSQQMERRLMAGQEPLSDTVGMTHRAESIG